LRKAASALEMVESGRDDGSQEIWGDEIAKLEAVRDAHARDLSSELASRAKRWGEVQEEPQQAAKPIERDGDIQFLDMVRAGLKFVRDHDGLVKLGELMDAWTKPVSFVARAEACKLIEARQDEFSPRPSVTS
jgi:hypothetical protein